MFAYGIQVLMLTFLADSARNDDLIGINCVDVSNSNKIKFTALASTCKSSEDYRSVVPASANQMPPNMGHPSEGRDAEAPHPAASWPGAEGLVSATTAMQEVAGSNDAAKDWGRASADPLGALLVAVATRYRIHPPLLAAIVAQESGRRVRAVSSRGALGLMQVMPGTARMLGVGRPEAMLSDPELALTTGARYLKMLQAEFGNDLRLVLAAYNAGPGSVRKYRGVPRYRETVNYVQKIIGDYRRNCPRCFQ